MKIINRLKRWKGAISLVSVCFVWIFLGFMNDGFSPQNTLYEISLLVLLFLTFVMLVHEVRQTASA